MTMVKSLTVVVSLMRSNVCLCVRCVFLCEVFCLLVSSSARRRTTSDTPILTRIFVEEVALFERQKFRMKET